MRTQFMIHIAAITLLAPPVVAQQLTSIDVPPGFTGSYAMDVSADGRTVAAYAESDHFSTRRAYRWTREGGFEPVAPANLMRTSWAISADSTTVVGFAGFVGWYDGFVSDLQHGYAPLGDFASNPSVAAYAVSGDGSVVVGSMPAWLSQRAMRWQRESGTYLDLGVLPNHLNSQANAISADGSVICGSSWPELNVFQHAVRWTSAGLEDLGVLPGHQFSCAWGISGDGSTIVGYSYGPFPESRETPVRWREGIIEPLAFPARFNGGATSLRTNWDGSVAVGIAIYGDAFDQPELRAALWTPYVGVVDLNDYLPSIGIDTTGWVLEQARGVSADGRTLVGWGTLHGQPRGFILSLPPPCGTPDFNSDGDYGTDADIESFFACLTGDCCATCGSADFNADGDTGTDADIEAFFRVLSGGAC